MMSLLPISVKETMAPEPNKLYCSALTPDSFTACALMLLCVNRRTGEEKMIDALLPDDRLATVLGTIRQVLGAEWTLLESFELEPMSPLV